MNDPTYVREQIDADPVWRLAFTMSEIDNDQAPLGWGRYITLARWLLGDRQTRPGMTRTGDTWLFTDERGDVWQLRPTFDPAMPLTITILERRDVAAGPTKSE